MTNQCDPTCPVDGGFYTDGSLNVGGNAVFLAVYGLLAPVVVYLGIRFRTPLFSTVLAIGSLLDVLGFVGRILLNGSVDSQTFFLLSLLGTVIGPAFITGALISILPHVLSVYGEHLSPFPPLLAALIPGSLQAVAVVVQVIGVVIMAFDLTSIGRTGGSGILVGGLVVQLVSVLGFAGAHLSFTLGVSTRTVGLDPKHQRVYQSALFKRFLIGLWTATSLLVIHCVYRIVEIPIGIDGDLFQNEAAFLVVNGAVPFLAAGLLTIFHPGAAFGSAWNSTAPVSLSRRRQHQPAHLQPSNQRAQYYMRYRYEPETRAQVSPSFKGGGHSRQGSVGLPSNPKAYAAGQSPLPSPPVSGGTVGAVGPTVEKRHSYAPERTPTYMPERTSTNGPERSPGYVPDKKVGPSSKMVDRDSLW